MGKHDKIVSLTTVNWLNHPTCDLCGRKYLNNQYVLIHLNNQHGVDLSKIFFSVVESEDELPDVGILEKDFIK